MKMDNLRCLLNNNIDYDSFIITDVINHFKKFINDCDDIFNTFL